MAKKPTEVTQDNSLPQEEFPILTSMGIYNSPQGWVFYVMKTQNDKVLNVDYSQDNMRSTCINNFKIAAQKEFMED